MTITDISGKTSLHNGVKMPCFGLGVWRAADGREVIEAIQHALEVGYRSIDTAAIYRNEKGVGEAIRTSGLPRESLFITSKVWNGDQGYDSTLRAFDESLRKLGLDQLDLYLVHWPVKGKYKETWKAFETIYESGRARAIGVSNFMIHHLEDLLASARIKPMVNQVEFHPRLVQQPLLDYCQEQQIQYEAWSPIMKGKVTEIPLLKEIGEKYDKNAVQVTLRWDLQKGVVTIPKSTNPHRIRENANIFDFELSKEDMERIDSLDRADRIGPHPDTMEF